MSTDDGDTTEEFDSFDAVSDEVRLGILKAFVEERRRRRAEIDWTDRELTDDVVMLSFSELRDAVGVEDSGRFNYHLEKLVGRFVNRTPKGYILTVAGHRLAGSLVAGRYEVSSMIGVERVDRYCPDCGEQLVAMYAAGSLLLLCENDHGETDTSDNDVLDEEGYGSLDDAEIGAIDDADIDEQEMMTTIRRVMGDSVTVVPLGPGAFEGRDHDEAVRVGTIVRRNRARLVANGVCPECRGQFDRRLVESDQPYMTAAGYQIKGSCADCGCLANSDVRETLLSHPAVVSFFWRHDIDVREPYAGETVLPPEDTITERSSDPLTLAVTYRVDGDELTVVVDETVTVLGVE